MMLLPVQVFAQAVDYTRTQSLPGSSIPLEYINQNGGTALSLSDDQVTGPINIGFDFTFYGRQFTTTRISNNGVIGFQNPINGCCTGYHLPTEGNEYGIFALQTDLLNIGTTNPWYRTEGQEGSRTFTVGWYDMPIYNNTNYRSTFEITLFEGSNNILLNYGNIDVYNRRYTAGIKGSNLDIYEIIHWDTDDEFIDYTSFVFSYQSMPEPLVWTTVANENESFVLYAESSVRYGTNGVYVTETLGPGIHSCSNDVFGDPTPGIVKQCQVLLPGEEEPSIVNCEVTPNIPECIVESLADYDMSDTIDQNTSNEEELVVLSDDIEEAIEDDLVEDADTTETSEETIAAQEQETTIREIANEERVSSLTDNISINVLEQALSIAENVTQPAASTESTTSTTQTVRATSNVETTETKSEETKVDLEISLVENSTEVANELLDTGRNLNNQSLATIQAQTEQSSVDSNNLAESIAVTSSDVPIIDKVQETTQTSSEVDNSIVVLETTVATNSTVETVETIVTQNVTETAADSIVIEEQTNETIVVEESISIVDSRTENIEQTSIVDETIDQTNQQTDDSETELELLQTIVATQTEQKKEDDNMTFNEDERLTLQSDINLQNAFNIVPNMNNLEQAGVTKKQEDKSDAEKRADQIVAANAKEQEEINNNYMDADQSGILGAMTIDTDVTTYRSAMLNDNSLWYKPEDIYKNVTYKDNVRNMYFLEKGNTDTYKQMVEEQYK